MYLLVRQPQSNQRVHMIWPGYGMGEQLRDALSERARHLALSEQKLPLNGGCIAGASHTRRFVQRILNRLPKNCRKTLRNNITITDT